MSEGVVAHADVDARLLSCLALRSRKVLAAIEETRQWG
jgi:maleate cis-trans isomerase